MTVPVLRLMRTITATTRHRLVPDVGLDVETAAMRTVRALRPDNGSSQIRALSSVENMAISSLMPMPLRCDLLGAVSNIPCVGLLMQEFPQGFHATKLGFSYVIPLFFKTVSCNPFD